MSENFEYNLLFVGGLIEIGLLLVIMYRQGVQNKDIVKTIDRNTEVFEKNMKNQDKVSDNLDRTERFLIESQTQINSNLENLEKKK